MLLLEKHGETTKNLILNKSVSAADHNTIVIAMLLWEKHGENTKKSDSESKCFRRRNMKRQ